MIRRPVALAALAAAAFLAACSGGGDATSPSDSPAALASRNPTSCADITQQQINALFPPTMRGSVSAQLAHIRDEVRQGQTTQAQYDMFVLWQQVLNAYYAGQLIGGFSPATQTQVLNFGAQVYCLVGLDGSYFLTGDPLNPDNKLQVVFPSSGSQDVVAGNGKGGARIGGGSLTAPGTVTLELITTGFDPFKGPLNTKLDQYGPFFEIKIVPAQTLAQSILIAQCLVAAGDVPVSVHLAHNVGTGIEILGKETSFLTCGSTEGPSAARYFASGNTMQGLRALGRSLVSAVAPQNAWAGSLGVGGKTTSFSPYGGVDTATVVEAMSATSQSAIAGTTVAAAPTVRVRTTGAHTPLDGANVSFVASGGGTITAVGGSTQLTTVNAVTGNDGQAAVGSWTLALGANTVSAAAAFPPPASGVGVGIGGSPVTFSATGTSPVIVGDLIPWEATGYKYLAGSADHDPGFQAPSFNDASWATGQGGFNDNNVCPDIDATGHTFWNSASPPTDMLLRHSFTLAPGYSGTLKVSVAIDNDVEVWVDGTEVSGGMQTHEGCATRDSFIFTVPSSALASGSTHVLAVRARDRGVSAFVDARVYVVPPSE